MQEVIVLRYGHRITRDYRVTSHCALVARAFGAKKIIICGAEDPQLVKSIEKITKKWGGKFQIEFSENWKKTLQSHKKEGFAIAHLTMYGAPVTKKIKQLQKQKKLLVIIGSQKVEREVYDMSDANISITLQPHSEIAALAVFLDKLFDGKFLQKKFSDTQIQIIPKEKGKGVLSQSAK